MIWPAMLFNLCVGLLFAGYLLRAVRRFERTADAILAKYDALDGQLAGRSDNVLKNEMQEYDHARDEIRASMRAKVDAAILELARRDTTSREPQPVVPPLSPEPRLFNLDDLSTEARDVIEKALAEIP